MGGRGKYSQHGGQIGPRSRSGLAVDVNRAILKEIAKETGSSWPTLQPENERGGSVRIWVERVEKLALRIARLWEVAILHVSSTCRALEASCGRASNKYKNEKRHHDHSLEARDEMLKGFRRTSEGYSSRRLAPYRPQKIRQFFSSTFLNRRRVHCL